MSASRMPTLAPCRAQASARFAATVDLPTPPLPEATATMFRTPASGESCRCTACAVIFGTEFDVDVRGPTAGCDMRRRGRA